MACAGYHTVSILHLYHHNTIIQIVGQEQFSCLLFGHSFFLTKLYQLCNIRVCLFTGGRIYDGCAADIKISFVFCNLFLASDQNQIRSSFLQHCFCCFIRPDILSLRKHDRLFTCFGFCFDFIYESHVQ